MQFRRRVTHRSRLRSLGGIFAFALSLTVLLASLPEAECQSRTISASALPPPHRGGLLSVRLPVVDGHDIRFSRLSTAQGLSQTRVAAMVQDNQGFMWLGTQNGLDRYDGYEYKIFTHDPARENSISCGFIHSLLKDRSGALWIGCDHFLDRFDNVTETFTHYQLGADAPGVANIVDQMSEDRTGLLWLATGNGLFRLNPDTGQLVHYVHDSSNPLSVSDNHVDCTFEDRSGRFWLVDGDYVEEFDRNSGRVLFRVRLDDGAYSASLYEDHLGVMWVTYVGPGNGSGLAVLDRASSRLIPYSLFDKRSGKQIHGGFFAALEDHKNTLWFASFGAGLLKLDREHGIFVRYRNRPGDLESLAEDRVISLCEDREGNLWAGLHAKEPNLFRTEVAQFVPLSRNENNPNSLGETFVNAVYQDHEGVLWTGTTGALNRIDPRSGRSVSYLPPGSGLSNDIIAINEDTTGGLWVGTFGAGLSRFDRKTGHFKTYRHDPNNPATLSSNVVSRILVDHNGTMWIATWNGLDRFNSADGSFVTYKQYKNSDQEVYLDIKEDRKGSLWIGGVGGVNRFDPKTGQFTVYAHRVGDPRSLSDGVVLSVYVDQSGIIWAGTETGLNKLNAKDGAVTHYFVKDGLPSNEVSCVLGDESGMLWMSTNRGLSKLDPITSKFTNYSTVDGLPGDDLTGWDACHKTVSGQMFFGGFSGGVAFYPDKITNRSNSAPLVLTDFQLAGKSVEIGPHSLLRKSISYASEVTLTHEQNIFSLTFAALTYYNPAANRYRYKLQGLDHDWIQVGSDRRVASYTTLPAANYTFYVETANQQGGWDEPGVALSISILPPWWEMLWFKLSCAAAIMGILWIFYRSRLRQVAAGIRARMEERLGERERIARELHDTLLQGIQGLVLRFQAIAERLPSDDPTRRKLENTLDRADEVITQGRDRIRHLRIAPEATLSLSEALAQVGKELSQDGSVAFASLVEGDASTLHPLVHDEAYWIGREALVNAFQHAHATRIELEIAYDQKRLVVRVRDNGVGVDLKVLAAGGKPEHWGLRGMRERAKKIGGQLQTWSREEVGTEVELIVPSAIAYATHAKRSRWQRLFHQVRGDAN